MRIDKLLSDMGVASRKEAAQAARRGLVTLNGEAVRDLSRHVDPECVELAYMGQRVEYKKYVYVMLNKPEGYVSATEDAALPVVTALLPADLRRRELFPVGRLDRDTVGLMLLTDDGALAHRALSPRRHVAKKYLFKCSSPLPSNAEERFAAGLTLADGYECKSAVLEADEDRRGGVITLTEGKYHQIKRMVAALGSRVTFLERISFAGIELDRALSRGEWRYLSQAERDTLAAEAGI